jgi:hypothetical protein
MRRIFYNLNFTARIPQLHKENVQLFWHNTLSFATARRSIHIPE